MSFTKATSEKQGTRKSGTRFIDCDIHNAVPSLDALKPYLSERWKQYIELFGLRTYHGYAKHIPYPKGNPGGTREDAWLPNGGYPGSDLSFMQKQLLDVLDIEVGILNCLERVGEVLNEDFGAALASAVNDWQIAEWLEKDSRLRSSIVIPYENPEFAVAEIHRLAEHPGFVQVLILPRTREPLGRKKYWKIYEAANQYQLPIAIHFAGLGGNAITSHGWPSFYIEDHTTMSMAFQCQVISLVCEGVFERFPDLKFVMLEGGFAWLPSLMWRLDKHWSRLKVEVPFLKRKPSEYILSNIRFTTQPMEEPPEPKYLNQLIKHIGSDEILMFATDYPHWDYDEPTVLPRQLSADFKEKILYKNAQALYKF
jgi:uncharacterized protein